MGGNTGTEHRADLDRQARISLVLEQVTARRVLGESVTDSSIVEAYPDLLPELEDALHSLKLVEQVRRSVGGNAAAWAAGKELDRTAETDGHNAIPGYELRGEIHRGGQGVVYEAIQQSTRRTVAIKIPLHGPFASRSLRRRFEREIELVSALKHPNIIAIIDSGLTLDGRPYLVMDRVDGLPIDLYVRKDRLALDRVLALFASVCAAVNHAHQRGVIHRDLKPSNILIDAYGSPRILDFGLAKAADYATDVTVSLGGELIGSLPYMSPEQALSGADVPDVRSDIYSLGVLLYLLLTGRHPYVVTGSIHEVVRSIVETPPMSLRRAWSAEGGVRGRHARSGRCPLDGELQAIVLKALEKEPERRYQSLGELERDVRQYLAGEPVEAKRQSTAYLLRKGVVRHWRLLTVAAAVAIVAVGGLVMFATNRRLAKFNEALTSVDAPYAIAIFDESGRCTHVNETAVRMAQAPSREAMIRSGNFHHLSTPAFTQAAERAMATGHYQFVRVVGTTNTGAIGYYEARFLPVHVGGHRVLLLNVHDMSSCVVPSGVLFIDPGRMTVIGADAECASLLGYEETSLVGEPVGLIEWNGAPAGAAAGDGSLGRFVQDVASDGTGWTPMLSLVGAAGECIDLGANGYLVTLDDKPAVSVRLLPVSAGKPADMR